MSTFTIWVTEHSISQRVGMALKMGLGEQAQLAVASTATPEQIKATPLHIGHGILRGMERVAALAHEYNKDWFHLDLGYTNPGHFHGNYRIGYKGTQSPFDERFLSSQITDLAPWKTGGDYALICPATDFVAAYFKIDDTAWCEKATAFAAYHGFTPKLRRKGDKEPLEDALVSTGLLITFNSSVGWQALQKGIPCLSDVHKSTVGSWHGIEAEQNIATLKSTDRQKLFQFMLANQLSLLEIQQGKIKDVLRRYCPFI